MDESLNKIEIDPEKFNFDNIYYVQWVDSRRLSDGWLIAENVVTASLICHSVGYLIDEFEDSVVVVPHVAEKPFQILGGLEIHRKAIIHFRKLDAREAATGLHQDDILPAT